MHEATSESLHSAIDLLQKYDSETNSIQIAKCKSMIASIEQEAAEKLKKRKRTFIIICCICLLCLAFVFTLVTINRNKKIAANKIRAEEIYNNFLGCRFSGSDTVYDEEFVAWVMGYGAELNPYKTYWTTKTKCSLYFKKTGLWIASIHSSAPRLHTPVHGSALTITLKILLIHTMILKFQSI